MLTKEQNQNMSGAPTTSDLSNPSLTKSPKWDQYPEGYMEDPEYYLSDPKFEAKVNKLVEMLEEMENE